MLGTSGYGRLGKVWNDVKSQLTVEAGPHSGPLSVCQWQMQHFHIFYSTWWKNSIFFSSPDRKSTQGSGHAKASQIGLPPFVFPIQPTIHGIALPFTAHLHCTALHCTTGHKIWESMEGLDQRGRLPPSTTQSNSSSTLCLMHTLLFYSLFNIFFHIVLNLSQHSCRMYSVWQMKTF